jgi:hypothetical protein
MVHPDRMPVNRFLFTGKKSQYKIAKTGEFFLMIIIMVFRRFISQGKIQREKGCCPGHSTYHSKPTLKVYCKWILRIHHRQQVKV